MRVQDFSPLWTESWFITEAKVRPECKEEKEDSNSRSVDGIPVYNASRQTFWPILCRIENTVDSRPFTVSAYCGTSHPDNVLFFMHPFVSEMLDLEENAIKLPIENGKFVTFGVKFNACVCDAPARQLVKAIIGHADYYSCERCVQKAEGSSTEKRFNRQKTRRAPTNHSDQNNKRNIIKESAHLLFLKRST